LDAGLEIVHKNGSSKNMKQHAIACEYIHNQVNGCQPASSYIAGIHGQLSDRFIAAHNEKPAWSMNAFFDTVREIEHDDVLSSGIFTHEYHHKHTHEWTKPVVNTFKEAMGAYTVKVTLSDSYFQQQQLISSRLSTCLLLWQEKEVGYS